MDEEYIWPTEEGIAAEEARFTPVETYCECLQYVRTTHTSKEDACNNKSEASTIGNWSSHLFSFGELVRLHREGMTVRHLPWKQGAKWSTRFLFIDIDNNAQPGHDAPNVTADELEKALPAMGYMAAGYTHSTSMDIYKWHVIIFLDAPARNSDEYDEARNEADRRLREAIEKLRGLKELPALVDPKVNCNSCLFAPPQECMHDIVLSDPVGVKKADGSIYCFFTPDMPHMERTVSNPDPRPPQKMEAGYFRDGLVPDTSSGFCKWMRRERLTTVERIDDMEFDFSCSGILPYVRKGASKANMRIMEGTRHDTLNVFALRLYQQARACNLYLEENGFGDHKFTDNDIVNSFVHYVNQAFDTAGGYNLGGHVARLRKEIRENASKTDREYLEQPDIARHATGRHSFRTRSYTSSTACKIIESFRNADGDVEFESVQNRDSYLKDQRVCLQTIRKVAAARGLKVVTARKPGGRTGAGRKPTVTWETLATKGTVAGGVFNYVGKLSPSEKVFINRNGLKMKKKKGNKSK